MVRIKTNIPPSLELIIKHIKPLYYLCLLKSNITNLSTLFIYDTKKDIDILLSKGIKTICLGYNRKLILDGIGFKASVLDGDANRRILSIRIGKKEPANYIIPENVHIFVDGNKINAWSPNSTIIDNFFHKILKNKAIKKGSLIFKK